MPARFYTSYEAYPAAAGASNLPRTSPPAQRAHQRHHVWQCALPAASLDFLGGGPDGWVP